LTIGVPGPDRYPTDKMVTTVNWNKMPTAKFNKEKVNSFIDQIIVKNKSPEKCSPGAPTYNNLKSFRYT